MDEKKTDELKNLALLVLYQLQHDPEGLPIMQLKEKMDELISDHGGVGPAVAFLQKEISDKRKKTAS